MIIYNKRPDMVKGSELKGIGVGAIAFAPPKGITAILFAMSGLTITSLLVVQQPPMFMLLVAAGLLLLLFTRNPEVGFYLILFTMPFEDTAFLTPALSLSMFLGVILGLAWMANFLVKGKKGIIPAGFGIVVLFLMYGFLTITWAPDISRALDMFVRLAMLAVFYVIGINLLDSEHKTRIALKFLIVGSIIAAGYSLFLLQAGEVKWGRAAMGMLGSPIHLGMRSIIALFFLFIANPWKGSRYSGLAKYIGILVLFSAIIFSMSRGPLLGLLCALIVLVLIARKKIRWTSILLSIGALAALGLAIPETREALELFWYRIEHVTVDRGGGRFDILLAGSRMFFDNTRNFLFGVGLGNFPAVISSFIAGHAFLPPAIGPHNIYLWIATELGVIGIVLFSIILLAHIKKAWQAITLSRANEMKWNYYFALASFIVFISLLTTGLTLDLLNRRYFWISMMFVQLSFMFARKNNRSISTSEHEK